MYVGTFMSRSDDRNFPALITRIPCNSGLLPVENVRRNLSFDKKTLSIPKWLNEAAEAQHLNFSQLLQHAVKERLGITETQPILPSPSHDETSATLEG